MQSDDERLQDAVSLYEEVSPHAHECAFSAAR